jgi:hypothetical protein
MFKAFAKAIVILGSDQALIVYVILVAGSALFQGTIQSRFLTNGIRKILRSPIPKVDEQTNRKIEEVNYKKHYRQYLNFGIKATMYVFLLLVSIIQIIYYFIQKTDPITLRVGILTFIIAAIEARDNYENALEQKNICAKLTKELILYSMGQAGIYYKEIAKKIAKEIADEDINDYKNKTEFEKLVSIFGNSKKVKGVSVYNGNGKCLYRGKAEIQVGKGINFNSISVSLKNKVKYLPNKYIEGDMNTKISFFTNTITIKYNASQNGLFELVIKI